MPFLIAGWMLSLGMFAPRHLSRTMRRRGFMPGSAPPSLAAIEISLLSLEKIFPRLASIAPLKCFTFAHLLWPAMLSVLVLRFQYSDSGVLPMSPGSRLRECCKLTRMLIEHKSALG